MGGILAKRLLRDLRQNAGRYFALTMLIVLGVFLVFSIVGAAEVVLGGTERQKSVNQAQDGSFTVFLELNDDELDTLTEDGTVIEPQFSLDLQAEDDAVLRMFRNREQIDLIQLDSGRLAERSGEAVLEKGYAAAHGLKNGDTFKAAGVSFTVTGLGSVPDYDAVLSRFSDTAVEHNSFGLMFVADEQYAAIRDQRGQKAEEYTYAYRLGSGTDDDKLKQKIRGLKFDCTKVENRYFQETIDEFLEKRRDIEDGVRDLDDGAAELSDGLHDLDKAGADLNEAADTLFASYLEQANAALAAMKQRIELTDENYADTLDTLIAATHSQDLAALKESLDSIAAFRSCMRDYTEGASKAAEGAAELADGTAELKSQTDDLLDEIFELDLDNLTAFVPAGDNPRIAAAAGDVIMDRNIGLIAGIIVLILFAYVISVFVVHQIEREQPVIGALYALGVRKKDLLLHYITMPTLVALLGGAIGLLLGFTPAGIRMQSAGTYDYFSVPEFPVRVPVYLVLFALLMPPVISAAVNTIVINRKLSKPALALMKNEQSGGSYRQFHLRSKKFTRVFAIRQLARESRSAAAILFGMLFSLMVVMLGMNTFLLCTRIRHDNPADTKYAYMYLYKYPEKEAPAGGEAAYVETLSTDCHGYTLDVTVIGLKDGKSRFFDAKPEKGTAKAVINSSLVERYGYKTGDRVTFSDSAADRDYSFTVTGICDYTPGFTIFMDLDSMRELFGRDEDYYNAVYADRALEIPEDRLYSVTTKADVEKSAAVFIDMMWPLIITLSSAGIVILCVVMYLMTGVMIDRSAFGISLIQIFGYRPNEIRRLYLNGNFAVVAIGGMFLLPLAKKIMDLFYPGFIANVACSMRISFAWYHYAALYLLLLAVYFGASLLLVRKIRRITPAEVLKNRE